MSNRKWNKGKPPHVGWWNASNNRVTDAWRWWNGESWSDVIFEDELYSESDLEEIASIPDYASNSPVLWTDYWPENASVPRINPDKEK